MIGLLNSLQYAMRLQPDCPHISAVANSVVKVDQHFAVQECYSTPSWIVLSARLHSRCYQHFTLSLASFHLCKGDTSRLALHPRFAY